MMTTKNTETSALQTAKELLQGFQLEQSMMLSQIRKLQEEYKIVSDKVKRQENNVKRLSTPKNLTMGNITAGTQCMMFTRGDDYFRDEVLTFLGFTGIEEKHSETPKYDSIKEVKQAYGVKNLKQMESLGEDKGYEYGHGVYAVFKWTDGMTFAAYLFEGKWCICSGAFPIRICGVK